MKLINKAKTIDVMRCLYQDDELFEIARNCYYQYSDKNPYDHFIKAIKAVEWIDPRASLYTLNGTAWNDKELDRDVINEFIETMISQSLSFLGARLLGRLF